MAEPNDESDFGILNCDVTSATIQITSNAQLHGQQKLISSMLMFMLLKASEIKLKVGRKELENINLCNYSFCDLLHNDGSVWVHEVEIIDFYWLKNLK